jgi:hypothetical protein
LIPEDRVAQTMNDLFGAPLLCPASLTAWVIDKAEAFAAVTARIAELAAVAPVRHLDDSSTRLRTGSASPAKRNGCTPGDEACNGGRGQGGCVLLARLAQRVVGLDEQIAHVLGPGFGVEFDQRLEFAQVMSVAVGVGEASQPVVGFEMVVHDDPAFEARRHGAALLRHPSRPRS